MSKKQTIIGVVVLGISLLLLAGVGWYGYQTFYGDDKVSAEQKKTAKNNNRVRSTEKAIKPPDPKLVALKELPRQEKIRFKEMAGNWITNSKKGVAVLKLSPDKKYRIVLINQQNDDRIYSQGDFDKKGDLLTFTPDRAILPPNSVRGRPINSSRLTFSPFPIMVSKNNENILWQRPSDDMGVYVPDSHALLHHFEEEVVIWKRMK